jgi:hypothetical protein
MALEGRERGEMLALRRYASSGVSVFAVLFLICGVAFAAKSYPDRVGDVTGGTGPDIASVTVSNTKTKVTFGVRFVKAPPLRVNQREGWIDMLLIGIDVPPLGPRPTIPGGEWRGANFALGTHGPSKTGLMVRLGQGEYRQVASFKIVTSGSTLTFTIPRRALGNPAWFAFTVAAAREMEEEEATGGGFDIAPARGTFRYALTG